MTRNNIPNKAYLECTKQSKQRLRQMKEKGSTSGDKESSHYQLTHAKLDGSSLMVTLPN